MRVLALSVVAMLVGCGTTEQSFFQDFSKAVCQQNQECDRGYFDGEWDSMSECIDDYVDYFEDNEDYYEANCDFDEDVAKECTKSLKQSDCDDFVEGDWLRDCDGVWVCGRSGGGGGGGGGGGTGGGGTGQPGPGTGT